MKKNKITVVGAFEFGHKVYSGQIAKTRDYYTYLKKHYGKDRVSLVDTSFWKKHFFKIFFNLCISFFTSETLILLLSRNGRGLLLPLSIFMKKIFNFRLFFPAIGGNFIDYYESNKFIKSHIKDVDALLFETKDQAQYFIDKGFKNIYYAPVFSHRKYKSEIPILSKIFTSPYRLCTYSRVCKEKGITDAIEAVLKVNNHFGYKICMLDIYGPPSKDYETEFLNKLKEGEGIIFNKPILTDENAIEELSNHYFMLFPTFWQGEGFPIAIVECMLAGLPVLATDWAHNSEVIKNNVTGVIYDRKDSNALVDNIIKLLKSPATVLNYRKNSLKESLNYSPESIMSILYEQIDKENGEQ